MSMVRRVSDNTSALGAGAPEVTMSANACSPGWLRSLEQFLPCCVTTLFPFLRCCSSPRSLPKHEFVACQWSHTTTTILIIGETTGATSHSSISFLAVFPLFSAGFGKRFCLQFVDRYVPLRDGGFSVHVFLSHASSHPFSLHRHLVSPASLELRRLRSSPGCVYAVVWLHTCPGPYFEVELVFIFFLPFVNAPGEIHRGEMVFGLMALRVRRPGAVWDTRLCPFVPRVFSCLRLCVF